MQRLRKAVALDPGFVLAWDALAQSLTDIGGAREPARQTSCGRRRQPPRIVALAPDSWIVKRERAYAFSPKEVGRSHRRRQGDHGVEPQVVEHTYPYINLIFSVGRLEETAGCGRDSGNRAAGDVRFARPAVDLTALAATTMPRPSTCAARRWLAAREGRSGSPSSACWLKKMPTPRRYENCMVDWCNTSATAVAPYFRDLGAVLHDRDAMLAILRKAAADPAYRGDYPGPGFLADVLGEADLAAAALRECHGRQRRASRRATWLTADYFGAVACPLFRPSRPSRIQETADRNGTGRLLAANRQVGRWLQAGRRRRFPVPVRLFAQIRSSAWPFIADSSRDFASRSSSKLQR